MKAIIHARLRTCAQYHSRKRRFPSLACQTSLGTIDSRSAKLPVFSVSLWFAFGTTLQRWCILLTAVMRGT